MKRVKLISVGFEEIAEDEAERGGEGLYGLLESRMTPEVGRPTGCKQLSFAFEGAFGAAHPFGIPESGRSEGDLGAMRGVLLILCDAAPRWSLKSSCGFMSHEPL